MFFHASQTADLTELLPKISNHHLPLVYLTSKRENSLVYLSNAVEKYCKEAGYQHKGIYYKWASYGFSNGTLIVEEYYPNALVDTYKGVSGYIYSMKTADFCEAQSDIPFAYTSRNAVAIDYCEFVEDAYDAIINAANEKKLLIRTFEEQCQEALNWSKTTIQNEYQNAKEQPEYRLFLKAKFSDILP